MFESELNLNQIRSMTPEQAYQCLLIGMAKLAANGGLKFEGSLGNHVDRCLRPTVNMLKTYRNEVHLLRSEELESIRDPAQLLGTKAAIYLLAEKDPAWRTLG